MPLSEQAWTSSSSIARDASATSALPPHSAAKPSPVPGPSTVKPKSGLRARNDSATACEIGSTVEDPVTKISPLTPVPAGTWLVGADEFGDCGAAVDRLVGAVVALVPPQAASRPAAKTTPIRRPLRFTLGLLLGCGTIAVPASKSAVNALLAR